jgi:hypothetical protein
VAMRVLNIIISVCCFAGEVRYPAACITMHFRNPIACELAHVA